MTPRPPTSTLFPYTTLFRSDRERDRDDHAAGHPLGLDAEVAGLGLAEQQAIEGVAVGDQDRERDRDRQRDDRSEEHTSELQSQSNLVCRLLLEKKKKNKKRR